MTALPELLTLKEAAAELHGTVKEGALRKLAGEGKLILYEIGGKHFTTADDLAGMLRQCQIRQKAQGSTSESDGAANPCGQSETEDARSARAAMLETAKALKSNSRTTLPGSMKPRKASVTRLKPGSRT